MIAENEFILSQLLLCLFMNESKIAISKCLLSNVLLPNVNLNFIDFK